MSVLWFAEVKMKFYLAAEASLDQFSSNIWAQDNAMLNSTLNLAVLVVAQFF